MFNAVVLRVEMPQPVELGLECLQRLECVQVHVVTDDFEFLEERVDERLLTLLECRMGDIEFLLSKLAGLCHE